MADEDKEKAEKLAAARKKFEQLKKQKAKKEKTSKGKADKADASVDVTPAATEDGAEDAMAQEADDVKAEEPVDETTSIGHTSEDPLASAAAASNADDMSSTETSFTKPSLDRQLTESQQSRLRSESFKSGGEEVYRKQAARIDQLEKDNSRLEQETTEKAQQLQQAEQQIEELREAQSTVAELRTKVSKAEGGEKEIEKLRTEIQSLERQNAQLQSAAEKRRRASSVAIPTIASTSALDEQLAARTATIETLELEISNLRHSVSTAEVANLALTARVAELEGSFTTSSTALEAAQTELSTLRSAASTSSMTESGIDDKPSDDATRLGLLTADLSAAQRTATDATSRSETLQKKLDTLTALHRDADSARNKELDKLRSETAALRAKAKAAIDAPGASTDGEDDEDETADNPTTKAGMQSKIRTLESEVFDLKRGIWREKRMELQSGGDPMGVLDSFDPAYAGNPYNPPMQSPGGRSVYDDVDLATPGQPGYGFMQSPSLNRTKSSGLSAFSVGNVLSAFTGSTSPPVNGPQHSLSPRRQSMSHSRRKSSLGGGGGAGGFFAAAAGIVGAVTGTQDENSLLEDEDEDFAFDEEAFRKAREEEDRRRLERVREVKRGLVDWKGWRVDLVEVCGGGVPASGVFDV